MAENHIDLRTVREILIEAIKETDALHSSEYDDDLKNSPDKRLLATRLLYLADSLQLASSLTRNEYWEGRAV